MRFNRSSYSNVARQHVTCDGITSQTFLTEHKLLLTYNEGGFDAMARAGHSPSLMVLDVTAQSAQSVDISDAKLDAVFDFVGMPDDVLVRVWRG